MNQTSKPADDYASFDLVISIVIYDSKPEIFIKTIQSLIDSINHAINLNILKTLKLVIIDNSHDVDYQIMIKDLVLSCPVLTFKAIVPNSNLGFGKGHNLSFNSDKCSFHLVLNPDVFLNKDALEKAFTYMKNNDQVGMLSPQAYSLTGEKQYLCKQYPTVADLFIRGFLPGFIFKYFEERISKYEMRGITEDKIIEDIDISSGCFMFIRKKALQEITGFSPDYFLYFEDFDFCKRLKNAGWKISYVPGVSITHCGGNTSKKGIKHIFYFITSAIQFFNTYGWKLW